MDQEVQKKIEQLSSLLTEYERSYYQGRSLVSDSEYDRLYDQLLELEQQYPQFRQPDSPTQRVGSDLSNELPEVEHSIPVLSLDKVYSVEELGAWQQRLQKQADSSLSLIAEQKIDGVSIVLYYRKGLLEQALTRGNGRIGNDVSANIKTIRSIPLRLNQPLTIAVRGEVFISRSQFEQLNSQQETPFANARNLAAGTIRRIHSRSVAQIPLRFFAYDVYGLEAESEPALSHHLALMRMHQLGFPVNQHLAWLHSPQEDPAVIQSFCTEFPKALCGTQNILADFAASETAGRQDLDYEIDGLVIKIDDIALREKLGYTGHHPRWAVALKFESPQGTSVVKAIDVQVGRTGRITPVARIEPVLIGGSTVQNVTLHNQDYIAALELNIGDSVAVSKRGDVIPAVENVLEKGEAEHPFWRMPTRCPSCQNSLQIIGAHLFCPNTYDCPDQQRGRLRFFAGRDQMDIDGLGAETIDTLFALGLVRSIPDMYSADYQKLMDQDGFGSKKIANIESGVAASKAQPYRRVLASLGIPELGPKAVQLVCDAGYHSIDDLFAIAERKDDAALMSIHGLGEKTARIIIDQFSDSRLRSLIQSLRQNGLQFSEDPGEQSGRAADGPFAGQVWVVTGSFANFQPRSLAAKEIEARGGRVASAVSGSTSHLLAGEKAGSKYDKALAVGAQIVNEAEFLQLIGDSPL